MRDVKNPKTILDYLKEPPVISGGVSVLIRQIDQYQKTLADPSLEGLKKLSAQRTLASNSLRDEPSLRRWQETNHWIGERIREEEPLTWASIVHLNKKVTGYTGLLREGKVFSGNMEYLPPEYMTEALDDFQKRLQFEPDVFIKAFEIYLGIATIHPFENGNGRTARLAGDWILMSAGFLPMTFDSAIQSHVAVTLDHPLRNKQHSFEKFLGAIHKSYQNLSHA